MTIYDAVLGRGRRWNLQLFRFGIPSAYFAAQGVGAADSNHADNVVLLQKLLILLQCSGIFLQQLTFGDYITEPLVHVQGPVLSMLQAMV